MTLQQTSPGTPKEFSFVIARIWNSDKPISFTNLGIYTYFEQVHTGTQEQALALLEEIQRKNKDKKYFVFPVTLGTPINE